VTIPFGQTEGGFDWVYQLLDTQKLVFGADGQAVPAQSVSLNAANIDFRDGALVDVSGGGDLQAFEFVPGVGGSRDILANSESHGAFAVLPGLAGRFAPYDPAYYDGSDLSPTQSVYLAGVPGLPEGLYPLLPARYALL